MRPGRVCWHSYFEDEALEVADVASKLSLNTDQLQAFPDGKTSADAELALRLAHGFGTTPQF